MSLKIMLLLMFTCYTSGSYGVNLDAIMDAQKDYVIHNKIVENTRILLEHTTVSISNSTFIKVYLILTGKGTNTFSMQNCTLMGSTITLQYMENTKIELSQFIAEQVTDGEESKYMLTIIDNNYVSLKHIMFTGSESAWKKVTNKTDPGSEILNVTTAEMVGDTLHRRNTQLGLKMENISFAEMWNTTFSNLISETINGSALLCKISTTYTYFSLFESNMAKSGIIWISNGTMSYHNTTFHRNHAQRRGGVMAIEGNTTIKNTQCSYDSNSAVVEGGAIFAVNNVFIENKKCLFQNNTCTGTKSSGGALSLRNNIICESIETTFVKNKVMDDQGDGGEGGAISGENYVLLLNIDSIFQSNSARQGGAILLREVANGTNVNSTFLSNRASNYGGAVIVQYNADCLNIQSRFIENFGLRGGGGLSLYNGVTCTNIDSSFTNNMSPDSGGAIFSRTRSYTNYIVNTNCTFKSNNASGGGSIGVKGNTRIYNQQNIFDGNRANTGSVIMCLTSTNTEIHISMWIDGDQIQNNLAIEAILHAARIHTLVISNTVFLNNTADDNIAGISIEEHVAEFVCFQCNFIGNIAASAGIIRILGAGNINMTSSVFKNNAALSGEMIQLKGKKATIRDSHFENNTCNNIIPCHLFIDKTTDLEMDSCTFKTSKSSQYATFHSVALSGENVTLTNIQLIGIAGEVLETIASKIFLELGNISYVCPMGHRFLMKFITFVGSNIIPIGNTTQLQTSNHQNSFLLKCEACAVNHYRIGLSSYSIASLDDIPSSRHDVCHQCPPGGSCKDHTVVAEPGYWGFVYKDKVYFVFCPVNYCCQSSPCASYDSCNTGRTGQMCTSCQDGYLLSMMGNECVPSEMCTQGWVHVVTVATAFAYLGFLLIKVEILNILQFCWRQVVKCFSKKSTQKSEHKASRYVLSQTLGIHDQSNMTQNAISHQSENEYTNTDFYSSNIQHNVEHSTRFWEIPFDSVEIFHIIVFHLQDTNLFKIRLPHMPNSALSVEKYQSNVLSVARLDAISFSDQEFCFPEGTTEVIKLLTNTSIIPIMIVIFLVCVLILNLTNLRKELYNRLIATASTVFLLIIMFSSQKLSTSALTLVKCEWLGSGNYLLIDSTVKCYTVWQWAVFLYLTVFILPFWASLFLAPGLLQHRCISNRSFLLGLLFPGPFVVYSITLLYKKKGQPVRASCHNLTTTAALNEVWYSFKPFFGYDYLCWGGLVELRRLTLVICATLIATPILRIIPMILVTIIAYSIHFKYHPYLDRTANACANVSLFATLLVGILNFGWATLLYSGSGFEYGDALKIGENLVAVEQLLTQGVVVGIISICMIQFLVVNFILKRHYWVKDNI